MENLNLTAAALVLLRLSAAALLATSVPVLSGVPRRFRAAAAIAFSVMLVPLVPVSDAAVATGRDLVPVAISEVLCGALFGFGIQLWLVAADLCSQLFGQTSGLGMMVFARGGAAPLSRFFQLLWVCVLLVVGGHRAAIGCLLDSFQSTPLGGLVYNADTFATTVKLLGTCFALGIQAGVPIVATLLVTMITTLVLSRMIPQIHVFATSTGLGALMLVAALWIGMGPFSRLLENQVGMFLSVVSQNMIGN